MKALLLALSTIVAFSANAGGYKVYQRINFQSASTFVPADKVCISGGNLYHKTKAAIAIEICSGGSNDRANCQIITRPLVQPMISTAQRCISYSGHDDNNCAVWETYALNQGPTAKIYLYKSKKYYQDGKGGPLSYTTFELPACADAAVVPAN